MQHGKFDCDIYNAANGTETSIRQLADIFESSFPGTKKIIFNGQQKKGDPLNWRANISKIALLGYRQAVMLEDGVKEYIKSFLQQH